MECSLRTSAALLVSALLALALGACGGGDDGGQSSPRAGPERVGAGAAATYVGRVAGSDANIALLVDGERLSGYVCDDDGAIGVWFEDRSLERGRAQLARRGGGEAIGGAVIGPRSASGEIEVDGQRLSYTAEPATGDAGLYRIVDGRAGRAGVSRDGLVVLNEVSGDELTSEHLYFDQLDFLGQLGLLPGEG